MQTHRLTKSRRLNDDLLLSIIAISPFRAATSMMATCHLLYREGAKIILRNTPVSFDEKMSQSKALSLARFIQAEHLSRCPYIRELHLLMTFIPDVLGKALIQVLPRMTSLKILSVAIEYALQSHPNLLSALSSLQSVKNLRVAKAGERSCELMRSFKSPLVEANVFFDSTGTCTRDELLSKTAYHPLVMLQHSAATLTTLTAGFLIDSNIRLAFVRPPDVVYTALHTLVLHECNVLTVAPYIKCCPNLARLRFEYLDHSPLDDHYHYGPGQVPGAGLAHIQREMNLALPEQLSYDLVTGMRREEAPPMWTGLEEYVGPLMDLWILGLTCPIARLTLEDAFARLSSGARAPTALTDVLAYARPTELAIVFRECSLTDVLKTDLCGALGTQGAKGLRALRLAVWVRRGDRDLDVGRALDKIVEAVSHLSLTRLDIGIHDGGLGTDEDEEEAAVSELSRLCLQWLTEGRPEQLEAAGALAATLAHPHPHPTGNEHAAAVSASSDDHDSLSGSSDADSDSDQGSGEDEDEEEYSDEDEDSGVDEDSDGDEDSDEDANFSDPESDSEPLALTMGERTLDAIDVPALAMRLARAIPTLEDALIMVDRPRRSHGGARVCMRTAMFGCVIGSEGNLESARGWRWVGDVLYRETEGPYYGV